MQRALQEAKAQVADLVAQQKTLQGAVAVADARAEQLGNNLNVAKATQENETGLYGELQVKLERATERLQEHNNS